MTFSRTSDSLTPRQPFDAKLLLAGLRKRGRTPETESLLKTLKPDISEDDLGKVFGPLLSAANPGLRERILSSQANRQPAQQPVEPVARGAGGEIVTPDWQVSKPGGIPIGKAYQVFSKVVTAPDVVMEKIAASEEAPAAIRKAAEVTKRVKDETSLSRNLERLNYPFEQFGKEAFKLTDPEQAQNYALTQQLVEEYEGTLQRAGIAENSPEAKQIEDALISAYKEIGWRPSKDIEATSGKRYEQLPAGTKFIYELPPQILAAMAAPGVVAGVRAANLPKGFEIAARALEEVYGVTSSQRGSVRLPGQNVDRVKPWNAEGRIKELEAIRDDPSKWAQVDAARQTEIQREIGFLKYAVEHDIPMGDYTLRNPEQLREAAQAYRPKPRQTPAWAFDADAIVERWRTTPDDQLLGIGLPQEVSKKLIDEAHLQPDYVARMPVKEAKQELATLVGKQTEMAPSTSVQTGLPGMEKPAQSQMFGEVSGKTSFKQTLIDAEKLKTQQAEKPLPGQMNLEDIPEARGITGKKGLEAAITEAKQTGSTFTRVEDFDGAIAEIERTLGNRSMPYNGGAKAGAYQGYTRQQLEAMVNEYRTGREALAGTIPQSKPPEAPQGAGQPPKVNLQQITEDAIASAKTPEEAEAIKQRAAQLRSASPPPKGPTDVGMSAEAVPPPEPVNSTPAMESVLGLKTIEPGLTRGEVIANWAKNLANRGYSKVTGKAEFVAADPVATAAMRQRRDWRIAAESKANVIGAEAGTNLRSAFDIDKNGQIQSLDKIDATLPGAPTIQDLAARLPKYLASISEQQKAVLFELRDKLAPYRQMLDEVGIKEIGHRPDVMAGGFYLPRGNTALEGADEPLKVFTRRAGRGGYTKPAEFASMAEGITKGYKYSPVGDSITAYANKVGQDAVNQHIANYFKSVTDETGLLIGETPKMRLMRQNPEIATVVEGLNKNIDKLRQNIHDLTERQMEVIDRWQHDPDMGDIDTLLDGLKTMRGGKPAMTKPQLKALLEQNIEALEAFRPKYKEALKKATGTPRDQGIIALNPLNGWTFPNEVANAVNLVLKQEGSNTGRFVVAADMIDALNNFYRSTRATLDNSAFGIQGLLGMYGNPSAYRKAVAVNLKAWGKSGDRILGKFLNEFDSHAKDAGRLTAEEWGKHGVHVGGAVGEFQIGQGISSKISSLPGPKQANRAFGYFGDSLRLQWADNELANLLKHRTLDEITAAGDLDRIANAVNDMTGWAKGKTAGSVGDLVLFAPRWFQSRLETVAKGAMGLRPGATLDQRIARNKLLRMIGTGAALTFAANYALGEETDVRPIVDGKRNSRFMKIKFKGHNYSLFGPWDSLLATALYVGTGEPLKALRNQGSLLTTAAFDMIDGKDFDYTRTRDTPAQFGAWIMRQMVPFSGGQLYEAGKQAVQGDVAGGAINAASQVIGVKSYPVSETEALQVIPGFVSNLGGKDATGLATMIKENEGASPEKIAEINKKDWTYDITSYRRDTLHALTNLKPNAIKAVAEKYPIAGYVRTHAGLKDSYELMGEDEQESYLKNNPDFVAGQFFEGYWSNWGERGSLDTANRVAALASKYNIPLKLIPAFAPRDNGTERIPDKPLWPAYFEYIALPGQGGWLGKDSIDSVPQQYRAEWEAYQKLADKKKAMQTAAGQAAVQKQMDAYRTAHRAASTDMREELRRKDKALDDWLVKNGLTGQGMAPLKPKTTASSSSSASSFSR